MSNPRRVVQAGYLERKVVVVSFIELVLLAAVSICFFWIGSMYEVQKDLVSRLSVLTGIVLGQMTPDAVSNLKAYNIEISQREPIKKRGF